MEIEGPKLAHSFHSVCSEKHAQFKEVSKFTNPNSEDSIRFTESAFGAENSNSGPNKIGRFFKTIFRFFSKLFCCCSKKTSNPPRDQEKALQNFLDSVDPLIFGKIEAEQFRKAFVHNATEVLNKIYNFLLPKIQDNTATDLIDPYFEFVMAHEGQHFHSIDSNLEEPLLLLLFNFLVKKFETLGEDKKKQFMCFNAAVSFKKINRTHN